ncbi:MAG TPA: PaaX family transcriptional regulator C-terminal domain-containing protein [Baekduia sp.]|nr:PaaX family transcriptional regulator C-terminal domain-containing protein [Baekduia sp.]
MPAQPAAQPPYEPQALAEGTTATAHSISMTLFGTHILRGDLAISSGSVIDVLGSLNVSAAATRSLLGRLVKDALLVRHPVGRQTYFSLTTGARETIGEGQRLFWSSVDHRWDGTWTLLAFSFPDHWQRARYELRARLHLGRFGRLQSGLWIAPSRVDVPTLLGDLEFIDDVRVFNARPEPPLTVERVIQEAFDIDALATRYRTIIERWQDINDDNVTDPLATRMLMQTEWFDVVRSDPRLPLDHLPADWPGVQAERIVRRRDEQLSAAAGRDGWQRMDTISVAQTQT